MNQKHLEWIKAIGLIVVLLGIGFISGLSFDYFSDGTINCYPSNKVTEIQQNEFQFSVRCLIK